MRVHLHDFSGHPFQVQLSRNLAARGHEIVHGYSAQFVTGHGRLALGETDPDTLRIERLACTRPMVRYSPFGRIVFELDYAREWQKSLAREHFDLVVACNIPLFALARMRRWFARRDQPWLLWHQDLYSLGVAAEAERRLPRPLAGITRSVVQRIEAAQVRDASGVVAISDQMLAQYRSWGVHRTDAMAVPNWAPIDDVRPGRRDNVWSREHDVPAAPLRLMYAGTLGRKHNPLLLLELLDATKRRGVDAILIVASEGVGADDLRQAAAGREDVVVVGYQPVDSLSDMLACADVMVVLLEPDAAEFSVPSKVLTYLSAGRPIIALVPPSNPAANDVAAVGGFVGAPTVDGASAAASWLAATPPPALATVGAAARNLAEQRFDIEAIGDVFERVFKEAASGATSRSRNQTLAGRT